MPLIDVNNDNFQEEVIQSPHPVVVDFWAEWCGPCRSLQPVLEEIQNEWKDKVKICKINVEKNPELVARFNVRRIPFLAFIKHGQKVGEMLGNQPKQAIIQAISAMVEQQ